MRPPSTVGMPPIGRTRTSMPGPANSPPVVARLATVKYNGQTPQRAPISPPTAISTPPMNFCSGDGGASGMRLSFEVGGLERRADAPPAHPGQHQAQQRRRAADDRRHQQRL